ncbi:gliding motility lipoprotein GldB [Rhodocytophaga aerolata]|uniref:Gliding motility lipoprotein GldB n=1 Tax=Rhodocytophaga aerolata TaxID=455078 RepID=A0ABT8R3X4_9BACT|nr:gliding motility lipoprotein GldB [Rhodocytophaga aerolata]MDO1446806.1 gliding motility lipoprotein GldB [Rhodocytophaga aerolata]
MKYLVYLFLVFALFTSCTTQSEKEIDVSQVNIDVTFERLEQKLFSAKSTGEIKSFLQENKLVAEYFLPFPEGTPDSAKVTKLFQLIQNEGLQKLYQESQQKFGNLSNLQNQFVTAFKHIKHYYPEFKTPAVQTIVTGFGRDLLVTDSVIVIGLDYFIGDKASFRPDAPTYILRTFQPEYIVPKVILLLSQQYNQVNPQDKSLLSDMIYYGKSYEFTSYMLPQVNDSLLLEYTAEQMTQSDENRDVIWGHFVEKKLLYETSYFTKTRYVDPRPYTAEIGAKAPGAIGRWLGWEIVKAYMREQKIPLQKLMKTDNAQTIFVQSKYKGKS